MTDAFTARRYQNIAVEFVREFIDNGAIAAGALARRLIGEDTLMSNLSAIGDKLRPYIHAEFIRQGYEWEDEEDAGDEVAH